MQRIEDFVTPFIKSQFPEFYRDEGPDFIKFVEAYYKFLQSQNRELYYSRNILEFRDIDQTLDRFLVYFKEKYLKNIQFDFQTSEKQLVKLSSELYKNKGTEKGIELFFKLVYNEIPNIYYPATDLLRLSDGIVSLPQYLEISRKPRSKTYVGKNITGLTSNAKAFVTEIFTKRVNGKFVDILLLSNVVGDFVTGELITDDGTTQGVPSVVGSLRDILVSKGGSGFTVGQEVLVTGITGVGARAIVTEVQDSQGLIVFQFEQNPFGYQDANTNLAYAVPVSLVTNKILTVNSVNGQFYIGDTLAKRVATLIYSVDSGAAPSEGEFIETYHANSSINTLARVFEINTTSTTIKATLLYGNLASQSTVSVKGNTGVLSISSAVVNTTSGTITAVNGSNVEVSLLTEAGGDLIVNTTVYAEKTRAFANIASIALSEVQENASFNLAKVVDKVIARVSNDYIYGVNDFGLNYSNVVLTGVNNDVTNTGLTLGVSLANPGTGYVTPGAFALISNVEYTTHPRLLLTPGQYGSFVNQIVDTPGGPEITNSYIVESITRGSGFPRDVSGAVITLQPASDQNYVNAVTISDGGTGYDNTDVVIFTGSDLSYLANSVGFSIGPDFTAAQGTINTYSNGTIESVTITEQGEGYFFIPTVEVVNSTFGTSSGTGANLVAEMVFTGNLQVTDGTLEPLTSSGNVTFGWVGATANIATGLFEFVETTSARELLLNPGKVANDSAVSFDLILGKSNTSTILQSNILSNTSIVNTSQYQVTTTRKFPYPFAPLNAGYSVTSYMFYRSFLTTALPNISNNSNYVTIDGVHTYLLPPTGGSINNIFDESNTVAGRVASKGVFAIHGGVVDTGFLFVPSSLPGAAPSFDYTIRPELIALHGVNNASTSNNTLIGNVFVSSANSPAGFGLFFTEGRKKYTIRQNLPVSASVSSPFLNIGNEIFNSSINVTPFVTLSTNTLNVTPPISSGSITVNVYTHATEDYINKVGATGRIANVTWFLTGFTANVSGSDWEATSGYVNVNSNGFATFTVTPIYGQNTSDFTSENYTLRVFYSWPVGVGSNATSATANSTIILTNAEGVPPPSPPPSPPGSKFGGSF